MMIDLKYIVTGTGRCGTLYIANVLTSMGVTCSHEAIFTTKEIEYAFQVLQKKQPLISSNISRGDNLSDFEFNFVADSSYMATPFLNKLDCGVIHLVRNPFKVIGSMIGEMFDNFKECEPRMLENPQHFEHESFIYRHVPALYDDSLTQVDRACLFYVSWNRMIEECGRIIIFHRIEDEIEKIKKFFNYNGNIYSNKKCNSYNSTSKKWNLRDIKNEKIKKDLIEIMKKYGYINLI